MVASIIGFRSGTRRGTFSRSCFIVYTTVWTVEQAGTPNLTLVMPILQQLKGTKQRHFWSTAIAEARLITACPAIIKVGIQNIQILVGDCFHPHVQMEEEQHRPRGNMVGISLSVT